MKWRSCVSNTPLIWAALVFSVVKFSKLLVAFGNNSHHYIMAKSLLFSLIDPFSFSGYQTPLTQFVGWLINKSVTMMDSSRIVA